MAKSNTIMIDYIIKFQEKEFPYREFFKPYSNIELAENSNSLFYAKEINIELDRLFKCGVEYINEERILPETPNVVLDMLYSLAHIDYPIFDLKLPYFIYSFDYLKYIGIYTELLKQNIYRLKKDLSFLINAYFFEDDDEQLDKKLSNLKQRYKFGHTITYHNKESVKDAIYYLCGFKNIDTKSRSVQYAIDLTKVDRLINLLKTYKKKDFIKSYGCFCLTNADSEWYFSISGTSPEYDNFGKKLEQDISQYFKHSKFTYCKLDDNVLSYGDIVTGNSLSTLIKIGQNLFINLN